MLKKSIALAPYGITVRPKNSQETETVDAFGPDSHDLKDFFSDLLSGLTKNHNIDELAQKVISLQKSFPQGRTISGILEAGEYGAESNIKDIQGGTVVHKKAITHADMLRFYFLVSLPSQRTKGILLMQKLGVHGITTLFEKIMEKTFREKHPGLMIDLKPLSTQGVFDHYLRHGDLRKIRLVRYHIPPAIEDAYPAGHQIIKGSAELIVNIRRMRGMPYADKVLAFFEGKGALDEIVELPDFNFEPDTLKFELSVAGKTRTIGMANPADMRGEYDITKDVKIGSDGHPRFESIDAVARELLIDIESTLYGPIGA
jgi:hypothetical protein